MDFVYADRGGPGVLEPAVHRELPVQETSGRIEVESDTLQCGIAAVFADYTDKFYVYFGNIFTALFRYSPRSSSALSPLDCKAVACAAGFANGQSDPNTNCDGGTS